MKKIPSLYVAGWGKSNVRAVAAWSKDEFVNRGKNDADKAKLAEVWDKCTKLVQDVDGAGASTDTMAPTANNGADVANAPDPLLVTGSDVVVDDLTSTGKNKRTKPDDKQQASV